MQRVIDDDSYQASFDLYLHALRGDVWTVKMTDRNFREIELFGAMKGRLPKMIAVGVVSHRALQADRPEDVAQRARTALEHIETDQLILSTDCGFGRQGCNRDIAFFETAAIAQARNILPGDFGLESRPLPAANPTLQTDIVPETPDR